MNTSSRRVLIANRGEIALRVLRACRELGMECVQVYSEADRDSLPVKLADQAICIGPAAAGNSYLNGPAIIMAALTSGATAIHPGYGFLSENPEFAAMCMDNNITFVGPTPEVIRLMGDKAQARAFARSIGIPTVPGSEGPVARLEEAAQVSERIGFPVLIKAAAGGGGRGMRVVHHADELREMFETAQREAHSAFGDSRVYVERYLPKVRHVEVQVLGDGEHFIHLGERDCSIQRRHQKLMEEAPAPFLSSGLRNAIRDAALRLVRAVGYRSAGTVEFIVSEAEPAFYFIEMNTRIQVEHPVTEWVTGIDIVQEQLRIALEGCLDIKQEAVQFRGHALECRINAEDPSRDFRPTPGMVTTFHPPGGPGVRTDSHLYSGYVIPPYYDSLLAKVTTWSLTRPAAIDRMRRALAELQIEGVTTTQRFHQALLQDPDVLAGDVYTKFVEDRDWE